jgi:hypothetical protein
MLLKRLTLILIITTLFMGALFCYSPAHAQTPPPASLIPTLMQILGESTGDYSKVHVNISWTENGALNSTDYYAIIRNLSH